MSDFRIDNIKEVDLNNINSLFGIVLFNALSKPPHFLLLIKGFLYGVSVKGEVVKVEFDVYHKWINRKNIKTLIIELESNDYNQNIEYNLIEYIRSNPIVNLEGNTCLSPVKFLMTEMYGVETNSVEKIFDLIPLIKNQIVNYHALNMNVDSMSIKEYTVNDIKNGIIKAQSKYLVNA